MAEMGGAWMMEYGYIMVSGKEDVGLFFRFNPITLPYKEAENAMIIKAKEFHIKSFNGDDILLDKVLSERVG